MDNTTNDTTSTRPVAVTTPTLYPKKDKGVGGVVAPEGTAGQHPTTPAQHLDDTTTPTGFIASGGFNTGRLYTAAGQRIWWSQRADGWLFFNDIDRMLSGWLLRDGSLPVGSPITPSSLMRIYDGGRYECWAPPGESTVNNPSVPANFDYGPALRI